MPQTNVGPNYEASEKDKVIEYLSAVILGIYKESKFRPGEMAMDLGERLCQIEMDALSALTEVGVLEDEDDNDESESYEEYFLGPEEVDNQQNQE